MLQGFKFERFRSGRPRVNNQVLFRPGGPTVNSQERKSLVTGIEYRSQPRMGRKRTAAPNGACGVSRQSFQALTSLAFATFVA